MGTHADSHKLNIPCKKGRIDLDLNYLLGAGLFSFHPENPSPLAGEGRGEGELKRKSEIPNRYHPHPYLPRRRGRGKFGFPDENEIDKMASI